MVKYDESNIIKQKDIMSRLIEVNPIISDEFEAQKLIYDKLIEIKEGNDFDNFNISVFVNDISKRKWKAGNSDPNVFVKLFFNEIEYAKTEYGISNTELGFLYNLSSFLLWEQNLLVDKEGLPMNQKRLIEVLGMSRTKVSNTIKSLESKKCLIRIWDGKETYYLINPYLMWLGCNINSELPKLFEMIGYNPLKNNKKD